MNRKCLVYLSVPFLCTILLAFCNRKPSSPVIARVGKSILTVDDFYKSIPPEYSDQITREQNINYVKQWIDTELLFQEAMRRKIDRDPVIRDRLDKMKKDLLAAEMMSRYSLENQSAVIDENAVHTYYELNKEQFIRERDVAKYLEIVVEDSRTAWYITKNGTKENFLTLAAEYSQQPFPDNNNVPYTILDDVQDEIRKAIVKTDVGETSNPIKTEVGYHIILLLDKQEKGGVCKEEEVWDEIVSQISTKNQKEKVEQLLSDLRLKTNVEFNSNLIKTGNFKTEKDSLL
jgi:peptidyl-prolyl cis-trans isomerase C